MSQTTYGSITIVDITDAGSLSVQPASNMPLSIIYDPDQNIYTPDWSSQNLTLTPLIFYNNQTLSPTATGVTVTWKRREGAGSIVNLTTGETVNAQKKLVVSANKFTPNSTMISYIVTVTYVEPDTGNTLTAEGQITFAMTKLASSARTCSITGGTVFKYNTDQQLIGDTSITLTGTLTGQIDVEGWQYKNSSGNWVTYPNSGESTTLIVNESDNVFSNDVASIKLLTSDEHVYDIHVITKLRDGAAGNNNVVGALTNDTQMIPFSNQGQGDYTQAKSQFIIYNGGVVDTQNWTITQTASDNVSKTASTTVKSNDTVQVTGLSGNSGTVTFTGTRTGYADVIKTFSVVRVQQGADGTTPTIYTVECSAIAINSTSGQNPTFTPQTITVNSYSQTGNADRQSYTGRIKVTSGSTVIANVSQSSYTITAANIATASANGYMTVELYRAGSSTVVLDSQTIVIVTDGEQGEKGDDGAAGADAINVIMGNYADVIPCTSSNKTVAAVTISIPFTGYRGITQVACSATAPDLSLGGSVTKPATITQATESSVGYITYSIPKSTTISSSSGSVSITFTCEGRSILQTYRWTRSTAGTNGTNGVNAKLFEVYTTSGNYFTTRESQDITMYCRMMDGATDKTTSCTNWKWYKFDDGDYEEITGETSSSLTVNNSTVDGYASYKVTCTYSSVGYTGYYALFDKLDPIQAQIMSSVGNQLVNNQGIGALYVIVTDSGNGQELDALKSDRFLTTAPTSPTTGDFYYHLDSTNKTVTLKKYNGNAWANASGTDLPTGTYTWNFRDKDGNPTTPTGIATTGKVIYIDGSFVNRKLTADVRVEI